MITSLCSQAVNFTRYKKTLKINASAIDSYTGDNVGGCFYAVERSHCFQYSSEKLPKDTFPDKQSSADHLGRHFMCHQNLHPKSVDCPPL